MEQYYCWLNQTFMWWHKMDHAILTELQHGPKTLEEICFRVHINQYEALHLLQQLNMQGKVKPMLLATGEIWYLVQP